MLPVMIQDIGPHDFFYLLKLKITLEVQKIIENILILYRIQKKKKY